jgi:hypothetical protein
LYCVFSHCTIIQENCDKVKEFQAFRRKIGSLPNWLVCFLGELHKQKTTPQQCCGVVGF